MRMTEEELDEIVNSFSEGEQISGDDLVSLLEEVEAARESEKALLEFIDRIRAPVSAAHTMLQTRAVLGRVINVLDQQLGRKDD